MHCLTAVWKRCRDGALPICRPLLSCIISTLFVYFLACHPYIFLRFLSLVSQGSPHALPRSKCTPKIPVHSHASECTPMTPVCSHCSLWSSVVRGGSVVWEVWTTPKSCQAPPAVVWHQSELGSRECTWMHDNTLESWKCTGMQDHRLIFHESLPNLFKP